ncbi:hypothetical protein mRhiFer1_009479 [Rhinolophus ferrumequinum]|uniref:Uncharacterized protein n=1 Tax=Rhinolophus ferrumequinum TaxID=59479 RepID=A0A7J7RF46_RHIFE|nr:hypothetical protein mRhiFer1_009479 [Rhinolophus ferrumequinum]
MVTREVSETYRGPNGDVCLQGEDWSTVTYSLREVLLLLCSRQAGATFPVLNLPPLAKSESYWPGAVCSLHPADSLGPHPTQLTQHQRHFLCEQSPLPTLHSFLKNCQSTQDLDWWQLASTCSEIFAKFLQAQHWHQSRIYINLLTTTLPTLVIP